MKVRLCSNITFHQVLIKILVGYCAGKNDVTNDDII